ncbi:extracellular solute-binding protein [Neobacillus sp. YX16]|uniref:extracellular solute-binding protein n=1 Tax=Neobacillus sp. YX16 TaxID=3047874 RepID=UPI0024C28271|nr:extracellular solute-binding protein [Neobacillus sp. YX16]WHZ02828.1 extracellular solute-binding protein [Neobacillus sp. YX16]
MLITKRRCIIEEETFELLYLNKPLYLFIFLIEGEGTLLYSKGKWLLISFIIIVFFLFLFSLMQAIKLTKENFPNDRLMDVNTTNIPKSIRVLVDTANKAYIEEIAKEYEKSYGINVEITSTDLNNLPQEIVHDFKSNNPKIDVFLIDNIWIKEFANANYLEPLNKYLNNKLTNQVLPISYSQVIISHDLYTLPEVYAFPLSIDGKFLYYNEKLLRNIGVYAPPKTWEELIKIVTILKENNLTDYGVIWGWGMGESLVSDYTMLMNAFGGQFKDSQGNWVFNKDAGLRALEFMAGSVMEQKLTSPVSLSLSDISAIKEFSSGNIPFMINWSFAAHKFRNNPDIKVARVPGFKEYQQSSSVIGGSSLGIAQSSTNKEWAWKFIEMIKTTKDEIIVSDYTGSSPVWNDMVGNPLLMQKYSNLSLMTEQFEFAINRPGIAEYSNWSQVMQKSISIALRGETSPKDALDNATKIINDKGIK